MKDLKGSKTEQNLMAAYAGESQARVKYGYYAAKAKKEGYVELGNLFEMTSNNENQHAKVWFKYLHGGDIPTTEENLLDCVAGEHYEWTEMYKEFAETAKEEGFLEIAKKMELVGAIEKEHEERYQAMHDTLKAGKTFEDEEEVEWICEKCGYRHKGKKALKVCPVCGHPQGYFAKYKENY
ncbi:MAG: rubrerythrin family protein [Bacilli bacterium]|jgi:rubrerythrin|nr:rubrerythrin family protein [Bacilli bacterium]